MPVPQWLLRKEDDRYTIRDLDLAGFTVSETCLNGNKSTVGHKHPYDEIYVFISGLGTIGVGVTDPITIGPGDIIHIPGNEFHQVVNIRDRELIFVCIFERR